jgi:carbon storage regulator CsrA
MLVLSRKLGEKIMIDTPLGKIEIVVSDIRRDLIRVGIEAPKSYKILREELVPHASQK